MVVVVVVLPVVQVRKGAYRLPSQDMVCRSNPGGFSRDARGFGFQVGGYVCSGTKRAVGTYHKYPSRTSFIQASVSA